MWRWPAALACAALASACVVSETVSTLDRESPPSHLGRPGWVRATARVGAWTGAVVGAVASVALLPVTWPISQLADEPLGRSRQEFLYLPLSAGASGGHFLLGAPVDGVDWLFRRAWVPAERPTEYRFEPQPPPVGPGPLRPAEDAR